MDAQQFYFAGRSAPTVLKPIKVAEPGPTEVVVKTTHAALNPVDLKLKSVAYLAGAPTVRDFSGEVIQVGSEVTKFKVGDRVSGFRNGVASIQKFDLAKESVLAKDPGSLSPAEAAAMPLVFATAWAMIEKGAKPIPGSVAVVLGGATSVGIVLVQLLKNLYNVKVVATCSPSSSEHLKEHGASSTINYKDSDYVDQIKNAGRFANIYDCVGGYDLIPVSKQILVPGGFYVTIGGDQPASGSYDSWLGLSFFVLVPRMMFRQYFGKFWGMNYRFAISLQNDWATHAQIVDEAHIKIPIHKELEASEVQKAFELMNSSPPPRGKIVLAF